MRIKAGRALIPAFGAALLAVAITTSIPKPAEATRYAIAYDTFGGTCTYNAGDDCDTPGQPVDQARSEQHQQL